VTLAASLGVTNVKSDPLTVTEYVALVPAPDTVKVSLPDVVAV